MAQYQSIINSNKVYHTPQAPINSGGEGYIYPVNGDSTKVIKIYNDQSVSHEVERKLRVMNTSKLNPTLLKYLAWPIDLVSLNGKFVGFVMPKLSQTIELSQLYRYPPDPKLKISLHQKLLVSQNICFVIHGVHQAGYVFGDFNPKNIGINSQNGYVSFFDTDSFHVYDKINGITYRCKVGFDGYVAPELLEKLEKNRTDYSTQQLPTYTVQTDYFALAVHIFRLIFNGYSPYNGIPTSRGSSTRAAGVGHKPVLDDQYVFKQGFKPPPALPSSSIVPSSMQNLLYQAFVKGRQNPDVRPGPNEWHGAIEELINNLKQCKKDLSHQYYNRLSKCPYCEADERYEIALNQAMNPTIKTSTMGGQKAFKTPLVVPPPKPQHGVKTTQSPVSKPVPVKSSGEKFKRFVRRALFLYLLFNVFSTFILKINLGPFDLIYALFGPIIKTSTSRQTSTSRPTSTSRSTEAYSESEPHIEEPEEESKTMVYSCSGSLPQEFYIGQKVVVVTEQDRLRVRKSPGTNSEDKFRIYTGTVITLIGGPDCSPGASWWKVRVDSGERVYNPYSGKNYYLSSDETGWVLGGANDGNPYGDSDHIRPYR